MPGDRVALHWDRLCDRLEPAQVRALEASTLTQLDGHQPPARRTDTMNRPRIAQVGGQIGFHWVTPAGEPTSLPQLVVSDEEPDRLVATHLAALDDALIIATERFGEVLGGGRRPSDSQERDDLADLYRALDRLCHEYAVARELVGLATDVRAGQIIGTAALFGIRARQPLDLLGPAPFDGELDSPSFGVVDGFGEMHQVDPTGPRRAVTGSSAPYRVSGTR